MENETPVAPISAPKPTPLKANFGLLKLILLTPITFGIYAIVVYARVGNRLNTIAGRYDNRTTMSYWLLVLIVSPLTLGIGSIVWFHRMSGRVGAELSRRRIAYSFGAGSYWLWNVLGILIVIGPFVYCYKLFHAMNLLIENYNENG